VLLDKLDADVVRALDEGDPKMRTDIPGLHLDDDTASPQLGNGGVNILDLKAEVIGPELAHIGGCEILSLPGATDQNMSAAQPKLALWDAPRLTTLQQFGANQLHEPALGRLIV
jgi:hypothetical protein